MAMEINIKGGTGNNLPVGVTGDNRLQTAARIETEESHEKELGNAYNCNSGEVNFTGTTETGLIYIKNTGESPIVIPAFIYLLGTAGGATFGEWRLRVYKNPTTGTLISGASALTPINRNFGSSKLLSSYATIYKGVYGSTVTNGDVAIFTMTTSSGRYVVTVPVILPQGSSLAVTVQAPAGTTDADVAVAIAPYLRTVDD